MTNPYNAGLILGRTSHSVAFQAAQPGFSVHVVLSADAAFLERTALAEESTAHLPAICGHAAQALAPAAVQSAHALLAQFEQALYQSFHQCSLAGLPLHEAPASNAEAGAAAQPNTTTPGAHHAP